MHTSIIFTNRRAISECPFHPFFLCLHRLCRRTFLNTAVQFREKTCQPSLEHTLTAENNALGGAKCCWHRVLQDRWPSTLGSRSEACLNEQEKIQSKKDNIWDNIWHAKYWLFFFKKKNIYISSFCWNRNNKSLGTFLLQTWQSGGKIVQCNILAVDFLVNIVVDFRWEEARVCSQIRRRHDHCFCKHHRIW